MSESKQDPSASVCDHHLKLIDAIADSRAAVIWFEFRHGTIVASKADSQPDLGAQLVVKAGAVADGSSSGAP